MAAIQQPADNNIETEPGTKYCGVYMALFLRANAKEYQKLGKPEMARRFLRMALEEERTATF